MLEYVFARTTLDAIYITIDSRNAASLHIADKLGFRFELTEPEEDGTTTLVYSLKRNLPESQNDADGIKP